jgi:hypothetical protein
VADRSEFTDLDLDNRASKIRTIFWRVVAFGAVLLLFDAVFSWLSTCDPASYPSPTNQSYEEYCSALKGPLVTVAKFLLYRVGYGLRDYGEAVVAAFTIVLAISTIALWRSTEKLFQAGERQIAMTRDIFVANQRPWIKVTVTIIEPFSSDGHQALLGLSIQLQNTGNTPALSVSHDVWTHPSAEGGTALDTYRRLSQFLKHSDPDPRRYLVLFPGDSYTYEDYRALAIWNGEMVDTGVRLGSEPNHLFFCVCTNYLSSVGDVSYQTGFIFQVLKESDDGEALLGFGLSEREVPVDKLRMGLGGGPVGIHIS